MKRWLVLALFLVMGRHVNAQICNGSLGDPIINITFGAGPNPGAPLSAATTNYQYVSNDCPNDGFYALRNATNACFGNTWHTITDHTGNANGYFMLVNASLQPSAFYLDTVKGLCGNTTYEFAAWVLNVLKPSSCGGAGIQPNLTFRMERTDGTVLQSYNTNDIPGTNTPEWKQYGFFFTTPANATDVVLRIVNNSQGGCGNDLALDDITFRPCGPQINTSISGTTSSMVSVCEGTAGSYTFNGNVSIGFNNPVVQWQESVNGSAWTDIPGATTLSYTRSFSSTASAGNYAYRLAAAEAGNMNTPQCRIASTPLIVQVAANPPANASNNGPVCEGTDLILSVTGASASWTAPNGMTADGMQWIIANVPQSFSGKFYVTTKNGNCTRSDSTIAVVNANPFVSVDKDTVGLCEGDSVSLTASGATTYAWLPVTGLTTATGATVQAFPSDSVVYSIIGKNGSCTDTAFVVINVYTTPIASAGADKSIMEGTSTTLTGTVIGDSLSYYWTPAYNISGPQSLTPVVAPLTDTLYVLHVVSEAGCGADEDSVRVKVYKKLTIPNAFSPNNDGINDKWRINGIDSYADATVSVFNRYGQPVFRSRRFIYWEGKHNGKDLPVGVYYYVISLPAGFPSLTGWVAIIY